MAMLLTTVRSCEAEKIDSFVVQTDKKRAKNRRIPQKINMLMITSVQRDENVIFKTNKAYNYSLNLKE